MPSITAVLHTHNDGLRLGRCLETLYPCDQILIVDRSSTDATIDVARDYGARIVSAASSRTPQWKSLIRSASSPGSSASWILCLDPHESVSESLAASLYEWKSNPAGASAAVYVREETPTGWVSHPGAETRLVPANWPTWDAILPANDAAAVALAGELLRFSLP